MQEAHVHEPFATVDYHLNSMFVLTCMLSVIRKANDPDFCLRSYIRSVVQTPSENRHFACFVVDTIAIAAGHCSLSTLQYPVREGKERGNPKRYSSSLK